MKVRPRSRYRAFLISAVCLVIASGCGKKLPTNSPNDIQEGVPRRVAVELFTATWCSNCPAADRALDDLALEWGDSITIIEYHPQFGTPQDPMGTVQTDQRFSYYGVTAPPVFIADGVARVAGALPNLLSEYRAAVSGRRQKRSPVSITLNGGLQGSSAVYQVRVESQIAQKLESLRLLLVVIEDSIAFAAPNGINRHRQVARKLLPDHPGEAFSLIPGSQYAKNGSIVLEASWVREKLGLAALVQDEASSEIVQSAYVKLFQANYNLLITAVDTLLDGAAFGTTAFPFTLYNTGNVGDSVIIDLPQSLMIPDTLAASICDKWFCYAVPFTRYLAAGDSLAGLEVHIIPYGSGRSTAMLTATPQSSASSRVSQRFHVEVP